MDELESIDCNYFGNLLKKIWENTFFRIILFSILNCILYLINNKIALLRSSAIDIILAFFSSIT